MTTSTTSTTTTTSITTTITTTTATMATTTTMAMDTNPIETRKDDPNVSLIPDDEETITAITSTTNVLNPIEEIDRPPSSPSTGEETEAREENYLPLDEAIISVLKIFCSSLSGKIRDTDSRVKGVVSNILLIGGGSMTPGFGFLLEERIAKLLPEALAESIPLTDSDLTNCIAHAESRLRVVERPRDIDPRVLTWKGGAVTSKLDIAKEMWIGAKEWQAGLDKLHTKLLFNWDP